MIDDRYSNDERPPKPRATRPQRPLMLTGLPTETLTSADEQDLVRQNSEDARQRLVLYTMRHACGYAQKLCKGEIDGEDIFSECYDALTHAAENYKADQQTFLAYAKPYIRGRIFKLWRGQTSHPGRTLIQLESNELDDEILTESSKDFDYGSIERKEQMGLIKKLAAKHLTENERLTLELHNFGDMTFDEIAQTLDLSRSRVQQLHVAAIKKLRKHFTKIDALYK